MMSHRCWANAVVSACSVGMLLMAGCASAKPIEPPAASPTQSAAVPTPTPVAVSAPLEPGPSEGAIEPESGAAKPRDGSIAMAGAPPTKSLKLLDGPVPPFIFAERRASEAKDHLAMLVTIRHEKRGDVITLPYDKLVEPGQWAITSSGQFTLRELAPGLRDQDGHAILIQGYTDSLGTAGKNDELSLRRAESVRDYLTKQGVPSENMRAEGLGARRPIAGNGTPEGRAQNRRIEIVIAP